MVEEDAIKNCRTRRTTLHLRNGNICKNSQFTKTCSFDSFVQGFVNVLQSLNYEEFRIIKRLSEFHLFLGQIFNNQNDEEVYNMRSSLLQSIYGRSNCESNVFSISDKVLSSEDFGSGTTKCVCDNCGVERSVHMAYVPIDYDMLELLGCGNISASIRKDGIYCRQCNVRMIGETVYNSFVTFLVDEFFDKTKEVELSSLQRTITLNGEDFVLKSVISFYLNPPKSHYTAFCANDKDWIKHDDLAYSGQRIRNAKLQMVCPHLLMYIKIQSSEP